MRQVVARTGKYCTGEGQGNKQRKHTHYHKMHDYQQVGTDDCAYRELTRLQLLL